MCRSHKQWTLTRLTSRIRRQLNQRKANWRNSNPCSSMCFDKDSVLPPRCGWTKSVLQIFNKTVNYSLRSKLVVFHLLKNGCIYTCNMSRYIHFLTNGRQLIWNGGSICYCIHKGIFCIYELNKLTRYQAGNEVLSSPSSNYRIVSTGYTRTMIGAKHDAYLSDIWRTPLGSNEL